MGGDSPASGPHHQSGVSGVMTTVTYEVGALENIVGTEFGPGPWLLVDQERIDTFAEATGDQVDPCRPRAREAGAVRRHRRPWVPHAHWSRLCWRGSCGSRGATMAVNYGLDLVLFPAPVVSGSRLRARAVLASVEPAGPARTGAAFQVDHRDRRGQQAGLRRRRCAATTGTLRSVMTATREVRLVRRPEGPGARWRTWRSPRWKCRGSRRGQVLVRNTHHSIDAAIRLRLDRPSPPGYLRPSRWGGASGAGGRHRPGVSPAGHRGR